MAGEALFLGWGPVARGREQMALALFQETIAYYTRLQEEGKIESFEPVLIAPHSGDLAGFIMLRGEQSALDSIRSSPEFMSLLARASTMLDNLGVVSAYTGEALGQQMGRYGEATERLAGG